MSFINSLYPELPQELLLNISEYGRVPPRLTSDYILQEVNSLLPSGQSFPWEREFILEYLRDNDELYQEIGDILRLIPLNNIGDVYIGGRVGDDLRISASTLSESTINRILTNIPEAYMDKETIVMHGGDTVQYDIIDIPLEDSYTKDDLSRALYLAHPRTSLVHNGYGPPTLIVTRDRMNNPDYTSPEDSDEEEEEPRYVDIDVRYDYPWLLATTNRRMLPILFPEIFKRAQFRTRSRRNTRDVLTDKEIIEGVLRLNPEYDLGDLLQWLRARREVCNRIRQSIEEGGSLGVMNELVARYGVNTVGIVHLPFGSYSDFTVIVDNPENAGEVLRIITDLGARGVRPNSIRVDGDTIRITVRNAIDQQGYEIAERLTDEFIAVRMCTTSYLPTLP